MRSFREIIISLWATTLTDPRSCSFGGQTNTLYVARRARQNGFAWLGRAIYGGKGCRAVWSMFVVVSECGVIFQKWTPSKKRNPLFEKNNRRNLLKIKLFGKCWILTASFSQYHTPPAQHKHFSIYHFATAIDVITGDSVFFVVLCRAPILLSSWGWCCTYF